MNVLMMSSVAGIRSKNVSDSGTLARIQELCLLPKRFTLGKKKKSPGASEFTLKKFQTLP